MSWTKIRNDKDYKVWRNSKYKKIAVYRNIFIVDTKRGLPKSYRKVSMASALKSAKEYMKRNK